jgi:hypothetical protein
MIFAPNHKISTIIYHSGKGSQGMQIPPFPASKNPSVSSDRQKKNQTIIVWHSFSLADL